MQRKHADLRWTVEPKRHADRSQAAIYVQLHVSESEPPLNVLPATLGKIEGWDQRKAHLAAVRMPAQHQRHGLACRRGHHFVGIVRLVAQQNYRLVCDSPNALRDSQVDARPPYIGIQILLPARSSGV